MNGQGLDTLGKIEDLERMGYKVTKGDIPVYKPPKVIEINEGATKAYSKIAEIFQKYDPKIAGYIKDCAKATLINDNEWLQRSQKTLEKLLLEKRIKELVRILERRSGT